VFYVAGLKHICRSEFEGAGPGFRVQDEGCRVQGAECWVQGLGCTGLGFGVEGRHRLAVTVDLPEVDALVPHRHR